LPVAARLSPIATPAGTTVSFTSDRIDTGTTFFELSLFRQQNFNGKTGKGKTDKDYRD